ncbi:MAG: hypothetical protein R3D71_07870 [Rickettsiales bacterium]
MKSDNLEKNSNNSGKLKSGDANDKLKKDRLAIALRDNLRRRKTVSIQNSKED